MYKKYFNYGLVLTSNYRSPNKWIITSNHGATLAGAATLAEAKTIIKNVFNPAGVENEKNKKAAEAVKQYKNNIIDIELLHNKILKIFNNFKIAVLWLRFNYEKIGA